MEKVVAHSEGVSYPATNASEIVGIYIAIPPYNQQQGIAKFLNRETGKIDKLIEKKGRQIELLKEKRATLINHAVTKGLDSKAKFKDSGIPWLGEISEQWKIKPYKYITSRVDVGIAEAATHAYADTGIPIIRSTNVRANILSTEKIYYINQSFADKNKSKYLFAGDLVTVRTGNAGVTAIIPKSLNKSQCFTLLISTLNKSQAPKFYSYFLNSIVGQTYFNIEGWGTAQINISVPILQNIPILHPSYPEQQAIANFLDRETGKTDQLIAKVQESIDKLREYRTALISAAVTGKIDVREEVN